jgi:lysozyme family protein
MKKKKRIIKHGSPTIRKKVKSVAPTAMEYILLFNTCEIKKEKIAAIDKIIDEKIVVNRARYEGVSNLVKGGGVSALMPSNQPLFQSSYTPFYTRFPSLADSVKTVQDSTITNPIPLDSTAVKKLIAPPTTPFSLPKPTFGFTPQKYDLLTGKYIPNNDPFGLNRDIFAGTNFFAGSSVPWYFIACVHYMECNFSFKHHLHNGDPLTGYTVHVPANRPKVGHAPPFTFEESAVDAIKLMKYDQVTNWSLSFILLKLEGYNGFGYNRKGIHTPYLWSYSNHYTKGKYVKDGVYDADAVSSQLGAAVILKRMEQRALISIPRN